jgi:EAL domain-containing protein (putative c-di-GMP-specific phosphodiesterase class I)
MDGRLPAVIPDVTAFPEAMRLPAAADEGVRSFVSVPVVLSDGSVYGTFCAAGFTPRTDLADRDRALMEVLAAAAALIIEPDVREGRRHAEIGRRLGPLITDGGPLVLLQPIVDLATGRRVGAEALSRFPEHWNQPPDQVFAEADTIGRREHLEVLALERAAALLPWVTGYVAMNVSLETLRTSACQELLAGLPLERVVLELSEHDPIDDYAELHTILAPLRARGMRLAIDDAGAGFSSLRHIVVTAPDVIKLDRSIVAGVATDPILRAVVHALVELASAIDARVVAEGIETSPDADALAGLGVGLGQGWLYDKAVKPEDLLSSYANQPVPA